MLVRFMKQKNKKKEIKKLERKKKKLIIDYLNIE